jgi:hypothetical protein
VKLRIRRMASTLLGTAAMKGKALQAGNQIFVNNVAFLQIRVNRRQDLQQLYAGLSGISEM